MTYEKELKKQWKKEETAAFSGWDFSHLDGRWEDSAPLPWDYRAMALSILTPDTRLLDIGTGGGEFLLGLGHDPFLTAVTEAWPPNAELCRKKLRPLGIRVEQLFDERRLPFPDACFDLILDRHESFFPDEVYRALGGGGVFLTQQVGGENDRELIEAMGGEMNFAGFDLASTEEAVAAAGIDIVARGESFTPMRFFDTGAVVYFCRVIPWEFPGFSVDTHFERLLAVDDEIRRTGCFECTNHRFMIQAAKPLQ